MIRAAAVLLAVLANAGCGAPGEPEPRGDLSPAAGTVAVVGGL